MPLIPAPETKSTIPRLGVLLFSIAFVLVQVGLIAAILAIAGTDWFMTHDDYNAMLQTGYGLQLRNENCDVVLYGDSSALTGLDPDIVQKITGLKSCNISEGGTIQSVVGSRFPLDSYLEHNKRPRFLLIMNTSSLFSPDRKPLEAYTVEGMIFAFRYERSPQFWRQLAIDHPDWILNFSIWAGQRLVQHALHIQTTGLQATLNTRAERVARHGVWPYHSPTETHCVRGPMPLSLLRREADQVASVRQRYGVDGTHVILNISPVPDCDVSYSLYDNSAKGLHDNTFERLPISYFNEGDVHFSPVGSSYISNEAAHQILNLEEKQVRPATAENDR